MSTIAISDLHPTGSALFADDETYLRELSENEIAFNKGGSTPACIVSSVIVGTAVSASVASVIIATATRWIKG